MTGACTRTGAGNHGAHGVHTKETRSDLHVTTVTTVTTTNSLVGRYRGRERYGENFLILGVHRGYGLTSQVRARFVRVHGGYGAHGAHERGPTPPGGTVIV